METIWGWASLVLVGMITSVLVVLLLWNLWRLGKAITEFLKPRPRQTPLTVQEIIWIASNALSENFPQVDWFLAEIPDWFGNVEVLGSIGRACLSEIWSVESLQDHTLEIGERIVEELGKELRTWQLNTSL